MDFSRRLERFCLGLFLWVACWGTPIALSVMMTSPSFAAIRTMASGLNDVAMTGRLDGLGGGGGGSAPVLTSPGNVRATSRTLSSDGSSSVRITWYDVSTGDVRSFLERRQGPNGAWSVRKTIEGPITYEHSESDGGLAPDTRYCYRVTAQGSGGETRTSGETCVVTQVLNDRSITRAQLRVVVANVADAGTDGQFKVALNEPPGNLPNGNFTAINTPRDDLERGTDVMYELNPTGIGAFRDVTRLSFGSSSTDEVCVQEIQLILNGNDNNGRTRDRGDVVYERFYGTTASTCRWVGGIHGALVIDHAGLRAAPEFAAFAGGSQIIELGHEEMESRLEALLGTLFYERTDFGWDPDQDSAVVVTAANDGESVRVHLDFEGEATGPNPEIDIDFFVTPRFQATASPTVWRLVLDTHGMTASADFSWWVEMLSGLFTPICSPIVAIAEGRDPFFDCVSHLEDHIETQIEASFDAPSGSATVVVPATCIQPTAVVEADASIVFGCDAYQQKTTPTFNRLGTVSTTLFR